MLKWGAMCCATVNRRLIPALKQCARSELVAIASRDIQKAQRSAKEYNIPKAYGSYQDLLDNNEINVVYIPLPNSMHAEWTVKAAQSGKHCLVEKPLVTKVSDVELLQSVAKENNVTIVEGNVYQHHPQFLAVQDILKSGMIGETVYMNAGFDYHLPEDLPHTIWKREFDGGALWNLGFYPAMFIVSLIGTAPQTVTAFQKTTAQYGSDVVVHGLMQFAGGEQGSIAASIVSPTSTFFEIAGTKGRIKSNGYLGYHPDIDGRANSFELHVEGQPMKEIMVQNINPYVSEIMAFEDTVLDGKPEKLPLDLSKRVCATIVALHESANQNGLPIEVKL
ncbi:putative oxidoreductase ORF334 [Glandiceps talaboti]